MAQKSGWAAKFAKLGLNPPEGEGVDEEVLERTYRETVRNLLAQHRELHASATDPYSGLEDTAQDDVKARLKAHREKLDSLPTADIEHAHSMIQEASEGPQHLLQVGADAPDTGGEA
jgi:hypothetical protein